MDSTDEKRVPALYVRPSGGISVRKSATSCRYHLARMVADGDEIRTGGCAGFSSRHDQDQGHHQRSAARSNWPKPTKPRETAVITEIDGIVKYGEISKGVRKIYIIGDDGEQREYAIPRGVHINVQEGERVHHGDPLMDGPRNPHDIMAVLGETALQKYLVNEIQEVYRLQGVNINDKHLEVISRQMMRWVKVETVSDTELLPEEVVDKFRFHEENARVEATGGEAVPSGRKPSCLGITKASLSTDSFISAASFQETTRVLTEAAINGKVDHLRGLKENVIMGRLIPAGTGMDYHRGVQNRIEARMSKKIWLRSEEAAALRHRPRLRRGDPCALRRRAQANGRTPAGKPWPEWVSARRSCSARPGSME